MTKETKVPTPPSIATKLGTGSGIDLDKILAKARSTFNKNEKGLAMQLTTGSSVSRPVKDTDFVLYPGQHWAMLTGIKGIPFGRIVQIAGKPDSGKSSHAMAFMKEAQDKGVVVILWDTENKFSASRFDNYFKGSSRDLLLVTSKVILEGADMVVALARAVLEQYSDKKLLIVWDSVGGSLSSAEDAKLLRESRQMAISAKENGQALHAFVNLMEEFKNKETGEERVGSLLINQTYANIGSVGQKESGGQKVEYYSSIIIQLTRKADLNKVRDKIKRKVGIVTRAKVRKNHLFDGEDSIAELDLLVTAGEIKLAAEAKLKESDDGWDEQDDEEEGD
jgi:recombination protein RecA